MPSTVGSGAAAGLPRPGMVRANGTARRKGGPAAALAGAIALALALAHPALAQSADEAAFGMTKQEVLMLALLALAVGVAMLALVWLVRRQGLLQEENARLAAEIGDLRTEGDLRLALLSGDDQRVVVFSGVGAPDMLGALPATTAAPAEPRRFLDFPGWLPADAARRLDTALANLRREAQPFQMILAAPGAQPVEATGRAIGALAVVRFTPLSGVREELTRLQGEHGRLAATVETMQRLCDRLSMPVWLRDRERRLVWVNRAYAKAVDAADVAGAVGGQVEFLAEQDRAAIAQGVETEGYASQRLSTVVDGDRRNFAVIEATGPLGSAGVAVDVSETEAVRMELRQTVQSQSETLDQLTAAIARFDEKTQLIYHNAAFQKLFNLTSVYLDGKPDQVALIDYLRTRGTLPEDRPLRDVKAEILAAYRATQPTEALWHLAGGRTLRVFASPEPRGGATWVFEDLTEKLELESRLNVLVRLQGETLDYLSEAVAVFGPDGRLRLSNPAFAELWGVSAEFLAAKPHIKALSSAVGVGFRPAADGSAPAADWSTFTRAVTAFDEGERRARSGELTLSDGRDLTFGTVPLPNGQTMLTFSDITDARRAERMLRERNEALEKADRIKTDFVKHVNYELRSPLTNIIGFSALLRAAETGPLNERQSDYLDYISVSTAALMTIVNDILDLASIDAGTMDLEISDVDIAHTAERAAEGVRDKLREHDIQLAIDVSDAGRRFRADEHRVIQILFNLLSNAANFAPAGSTIGLKAARTDGDVVFEVHDDGPGIAPELRERIFDRFESAPVGGRHSGAGLGLSIVKSFVDLHKGAIDIHCGAAGGTTVICRFPAETQPLPDAAE